MKIFVLILAVVVLISVPTNIFGADEKNIVVYPGEGIEINNIDTSLDGDSKVSFRLGDKNWYRIIAELGTPTAVHYPAAKWKCIFYLRHKMIFWLNINDNSLEMIDVWSDNCQTKEGIKIGDTFDKLKAVYGDGVIIPPLDLPSRTDINNYQVVIYENRGITFGGRVRPEPIITNFSIYPAK